MLRGAVSGSIGRAVCAASLAVLSAAALVSSPGSLALSQSVSATDLIEQGNSAFTERFIREEMANAIASYKAVLPSLDLLAVQSQAFVLNRLSQLYYEQTTFSPGNTPEDRQAFQRGTDYGLRSLRLNPHFVDWEARDFTAAVSFVADPAALLWTAHNWGGLSNLNPLQGMLDLSKVRSLYERCIDVDEAYWGASAHNALGAMLVVTPGILGGDPEAGRTHLERAIALDSAYLENRVVYAQYWGYTYDIFGNLTGVRDAGLIEHELGIVLREPIGGWPFWNNEAKKEAEALLKRLREVSP